MAERECSSTGCTKESCEGCPSRQQKPESMLEAQNAYSNIRHVVGVVSGKGGVGKSLVTASLANLLLPEEEAPVIWRGPILANMVKQFWTDVAWGELDYLFVDMPPGTGDVPLTVFQSIPVEGIIVVTSPQDLVRLIVKKALNMAEAMKIPVLGLVENYSYVVCPDCGREYRIFGESGIDALSDELDLPVLGKMPIDPKLAELANGAFHEAENEYLLQAENRLMFL